MPAEKISWDFRDLPYGPDPLQKFDMACKRKGSVHAIVHIHGGAFFSGSRAHYPSFLAHYAKDNLVATIDYRVISPDNDICMKDILSDIDSALSAMINISGSGGIEIRDFVLLGHSAGGQLVLMYAYGYPQKNARVKIAACLSMAGPTDLSDDLGWPLMPTWGKTIEERLAFYSWMGSRLSGANVRLTQSDWTAQCDYPEMEKHVNAISPVAFVTHDSGLPPTLLVHGRGDDQVPYTNAVILKRALDDAAVPNKLITPEGDGSDHLLGGKVGHSSDLVSYRDQAWVDEAIKWLETYTFTFENARQKR